MIEYTYYDEYLPIAVADCDLAFVSTAINTCADIETPLINVGTTNGSALCVRFENELSVPEKTVLDGDVLPCSGLLGNSTNLFDLPGYKKMRCAAIDKRTQELIGAGFVYSDFEMSASVRAQSKLMLLTQDADALTYPIELAKKNDLETPYAIPDKVTLKSVFSFLRAHVQTHIYSGEDLKDQIRAAVDTAGVAAVEDTR